MLTRDEILNNNPLVPFLEQRGIKLVGRGRQLTTNRCAQTEHGKGHLCVSIDTERGLWHCNDCGVGGSIIDWMSMESGQPVKQVLETLNPRTGPVLTSSATTQPAPRPKIAALYNYTNESGELLYQAVRLDPKDFRQRRPVNGKWVWDMDGVVRVLFNLPLVLKAKQVGICEGEKDCQTAESFGLVSTCNVGGAGKWLDAYAEAFNGKDVLIFPDNDKAGREHAQDILKSVSGVANSVKMVIVPQPYKDLTEWIESFPDREQAGREFLAHVERTAHTVKPAPLYGIREMEEMYRAQMQQQATHRFNFGNLLPELGQLIEPMVPGEVALILADTGVGKTMLLQNLVRSASPLPSLLFELELPLALVFERFVQMEIGCYRRDVQAEYREQTIPLWKKYSGLAHITVCPESGLSLDEIERYIIRSELKVGQKPVVVAIDYVGLVKSLGSKNRYENISNVAEQLKTIAKRTNVILLMASQIARPEKKKDDSLAVGLHDGKDSGALENSSGIVIGAWRPERSRLMLRILKNTSGISGDTVEALVHGETMRISPTR